MGKRERVDEIRLEMIVPRWKTESVLTAMRKAHPYEEVAFDIYDLSNQSPQFGAGAIGTLRRSISLGKFLSGVKASLDARAVRYCGKLERKVSTVAVCGGSGGEYLEAAIGQKADVFLTADLRYHTFQECDDRLALVDAGHYETELPVLRKIASYLLAQAEVIRSKIQVIISQEKTNFIHTI